MAKVEDIALMNGNQNFQDFINGKNIIFCLDYSWVDITELFCQAKRCQRTAFDKKMPFNFTKDLLSDILNQNLAKICQMPLAKKGVVFFAQKLMKSTSCALLINYFFVIVG